MKELKSIWKGLFVCLIIGIISKYLGGMFEKVGAATFAIFIGIILGNTIFKDKSYDGGTKFAEKDLLNYSIVLMGANLNLSQILGLGINGLLFIILQMTLTIIATFYIGKKLKFNRKFSLLMAAGNSVCGSSAIGATSPVIKAEDDDKVMSITIVNVTGTILMILLPIITMALYNNDVLHSSAMIGGTLQSVGQVIGSAKFISEDVVNLATVFKILRIIMLVVVVIVFEKINNSEESKIENKVAENLQSKDKGSFSSKFKKINIPWFIYGFFIVCIFYTLGLIPDIISKIFKWISGNFEIIALAGIGMRVKFKDLVKEGPKGMLYGGLVGICQITFAIILISILL